MSDTSDKAGESFSNLLRSARQQVARLREAGHQSDVRRTEILDSSIQDLTNILKAMEGFAERLQDPPPATGTDGGKTIEEEIAGNVSQLGRFFESNLIGITVGDCEGQIKDGNE